jgi:hypothetical protein
MATELLTFVRKGGAIPKAYEERLMGPRSLVGSWKNSVSKYRGGYLITKAKPGAVREAVYVIGVKNVLDVNVGVLPGCKFRPDLLAKKDPKTGGHTLPLNESQKPFDLMKPGQIASCCQDLTNEMQEAITMLESPTSKDKEGTKSGLHHEKHIYAEYEAHLEPKAEAPKAEAPKAEAKAPKAEASNAEAPKAEATATN